MAYKSPPFQARQPHHTSSEARHEERLLWPTQEGSPSRREESRLQRVSPLYPHRSLFAPHRHQDGPRSSQNGRTEVGHRIDDRHPAAPPGGTSDRHQPTRYPFLRMPLSLPAAAATG